MLRWFVARLVCVVALLCTAPGAAFAQAQDQSVAADPRNFSQTGYRVDRDTFWDYFLRRGGVTTFGYPVSRDFMFEGCTVQFFQRIVLQQCPNAGVSTLNLLDDGLLPYTQMNGSTFPASDSTITASAPKVSDPNYGARILAFVRAYAVDTFDGQSVNFGKTFFNTINPSTGGTSDANLLGLLDLEIWGAPTSEPAYDPTNHNFIYQRFQRGIMHYDRGCGCTQGLLLADYLKELITGQGLPADLALQAATSPLLKSAIDGQPPFGTTYGNAFAPGPGSATATAQDPAFLPLPTTATAIVPVTPTAVPSPDYGLSMFLWNEPTTTARDLKIAKDANFHWQKTMFQWKDIEGTAKGVFDWTEADRIVKASNANGTKIIARIDRQPSWARRDGASNGPPDNYQDYADFISAFVSRYKHGSSIGTVDAIEVWNEVNLTREWGGQAITQQQAGDYVRLLTLAYRAAHAADPNVVVITAGLSPTGVHNRDADDDAEYLQWLFSAGLKGGVNYDVLGAHGNTQAPCVACDLDSLSMFGDPSFYFRRVEQLRAVQVRNGDADRQIWLLEFGWTADAVHPNYAWFAVSEEQKADNIVQAFQYARQHWSPWIGVMTLWTLADPTWTPDREEYWWAIDNPDGTPRAALTAIRSGLLTASIP
ncbi:MAG: endo-1,4-beta-xylanase [Chloroflexi bacterium]|nr:endo-1,4-beta-xylanase [Chloroflexota bacterium]